MATYIFQTIDEFKQSGGFVNRGMTLETLDSSINNAWQRHLLPWIGRALWQEMLDYVEVGSISDSDPEGRLLIYLRRPLAMLACYEYSFIGGIQYAENGAFRVENEDHKTPFKYQEANYRESMLNNGYESLEELQLFLNDNRADYPSYTADDAYVRSRSLVINYASELRDHYSTYLSRYTFETLRPLIEDVETFALIPTIGQAQYDAIKAGILADDLTVDESALLPHLQRITANFAVQEGVMRHYLQIDGANVVHIVQRSIDARQQKVTPSNVTAAVSLQVMQSKDFANRYIGFLIDWLDERLDNYPLYAAYKTEQEEAEAAAEAEAEAAERQGEAAILYGDEIDTNTVSGRRGIHSF